MPRQNAVAIRPGSKLRAWDEDWEVVENNTLTRTLTLRKKGGYLKTVRYQPGQEIFLRYIPFHRGGGL